MALHVIPEDEKELHEESQDCMCEPQLIMDKESGEMVFAHQLLDPERLFDDFIQI